MLDRVSWVEPGIHYIVSFDIYTSIYLRSHYDRITNQFGCILIDENSEIALPFPTCPRVLRIPDLYNIPIRLYTGTPSATGAQQQYQSLQLPQSCATTPFPSQSAARPHPQDGLAACSIDEGGNS